MTGRSVWRRWLASRRYAIVDGSMRPALEPGDRVLVDRRAYRGRAPARGEVVLARDPTEPSRDLVKRVALVGPGEYAHAIDGLLPTERPRVPVPAGWVFLLSDARSDGVDSRRFGPVPIDRIGGEVWFRYGPAHRRGPIGPP